MILYKSTRGQEKQYSFSETILRGTANDGGLFVPELIPQITLKQLKSLSTKSYQQRAAFIFNIFKTGLSKNLIKNIVDKAYSSNFDNQDIAPIIHLKNNLYVEELWHGPTSAFKDMALQIMPLFFSEAVKKHKKNHYLILVATSGDTGKAALDGYKDLPNISIITFFPNKRISKLQELQMTTQVGKNLAAYAMRGNFDDVQRSVKETFNNKEFAKILKRENIILSSANSINWGRILPQITYHINSYVELMSQGVISIGDKIDISVPSGNFGNILSAYYAKQMGVPIDKLICASNENNVLTDFLQTGVYDIRRRQLTPTPSPSMDILIASNIERLLYIITPDSTKVRNWMSKLKTEGIFEVDEKIKERFREDFVAGWVSNKESLVNIGNIVKDTGYLMDPHTSVAQAVAEKYGQKVKPILICSTAHWAKFPVNVLSAIISGRKNKVKKIRKTDEFRTIEQIIKLVKGASTPKSIKELEHKPVLHTGIFDATESGIQKAIRKYFPSAIIT